MMARKKTKSAVIRSEQENEEPGVWITQLKDSVNFGVRMYGSATKTRVKRAQEYFATVKYFVDVELPQLTAKHLADVLKASVPAPERAKEETTC